MFYKAFMCHPILRQFIKSIGFRHQRHKQAVQVYQSCRYFRFFSSTMMKEEANSGGDHLSRTSSNTREDGIHLMSVKAISALSSSVKEIVLASEKIPAPFSFKAGQWVDVFIPGVDTVGGFSMSSSPQELNSHGYLRLAIKYSTHPPALWMHEQCKLGDKLRIRVGGDFYLTCDSTTEAYRILLIAGGVGINPLSSMIRYVMDGKQSLGYDTKVCLLYSAKTKNELIFKDIFDGYHKVDSMFLVKYFLTAENSPVMPEDAFHLRRMCSSHLRSSVNWLTESEDDAADRDNVKVFICGPPSMITEVKDDLHALNIKNIHYEKWW